MIHGLIYMLVTYTTACQTCERRSSRTLFDMNIKEIQGKQFLVLFIVMFFCAAVDFVLR
jgi:hypothetical protein